MTRTPVTARRRGATAVETALVISIALLFLFGIVEYARLLFFLHVADNAVREGARYAVVHTGDGTTTAQVQSVVTNAMNGQQSALTGYTVNVFYADPATGQAMPGAWTDAPFGGAIAVQVTGTYQFVLPSFLGFAGPNMAMKIQSLMSSEAN